MRSNMLNMTKADIGMFDNFRNQITPKIDDIARVAEDLPNLETATSEELNKLKNNLEMQKAHLQKISANIDKRAQRANQRRQRLAIMRRNLV
jgi:predicted  nucleic acid-binding Zn-ribbon protein